MLLFLPPHLQSVLLFYPHPYLQIISPTSSKVPPCPHHPPSTDTAAPGASLPANFSDQVQIVKVPSQHSLAVQWLGLRASTAVGQRSSWVGEPRSHMRRGEAKKKAPSQQASHALAQAATFSASPGSPTLTRRDAAGMQDLARARELLRSGTRPALPSTASIPSPASRAVLTE